jgi:hypothetical protein
MQTVLGLRAVKSICCQGSPSCAHTDDDYKTKHVLSCFAGRKIQVYFTDTSSTDKVALSCGPGAWRRSDGWLHGAQKACVRAQSYVMPYNPGITAREALALPFFSFSSKQPGAS